MKTRAAILKAMGLPAPYARSRPLSIETVDLAPPGPGEVLVKIRAAGLCHSDLSVINGDRPRPLPMVLGHEAAGVVEELGEGVVDLKAGDPSCQHTWRWSGEIFTTYPMKQHRVCTACGRTECVAVCDDKQPMDECKRPTCKNHLDRQPVPESGTPAYAIRNGLYVPRSME